MADRRFAAAPFLAIGIAFLALGASGRTAFLWIGCAFIAIAALFSRARRR